MEGPVCFLCGAKHFSTQTCRPRAPAADVSVLEPGAVAEALLTDAPAWDQLPGASKPSRARKAETRTYAERAAYLRPKMAAYMRKRRAEAKEKGAP